MSALLEMRGIVRRFGNVRANDGIDLTVRAGQIVGLLGENGSGKSTLMKVLFGLLPPDEGAIVFRGVELARHRPADAMTAGLAMIHQHFMLIEAMTVVENVMLGWREAGRLLRRAAIRTRVRDASARLGLDLDPDARVADLPLGRRQRVEILKAVLRDAALLILDEPTSNLAPPEVAGLLAILRRLRDEGRGIVFITHKMPEVLEVCDEVVVLRAGRVAGRTPIGRATTGSLAEMMVGRAVTAPPAMAARTAGPPLLAVRGLCGAGLAGIDLTVHAGEVVGVAGVDGNGQLELADTLAGLRPATGGQIRLGERDVTRASVAARMRAGLAYIPADRATTSLVRAMSVAENLTLRGPGGRSTGREARVLALMATFDIRAAGPHSPAAILSGGNQQKIVIAREMDRAPSVLVAHQAAWGLDPGATQFVLTQVAAMRDEGGAILYISSELEEVLAISDRVAVIAGGRFAGIVPRDRLDLRRIGEWMAGRVA